ALTTCFASSVKSQTKWLCWCRLRPKKPPIPTSQMSRSCPEDPRKCLTYQQSGKNLFVVDRPRRRLMTLKGKTALVTGASRGIGRGIALKLAESGAKVAVHHYQKEDQAKATLEKLRACGSDGFIVPADALAVGNRGWRWAQPRQRLKFCAAISLWLSRGKSRSTPSAPAGPTTASSTLCPKRCRTPSVIGSRRVGLPCAGWVSRPTSEM